MEKRYYIKYSNGSLSTWFYYRKDAVTQLLLQDYIVLGDQAENIYDNSDLATIITVREYELVG